MLTRLRINRFKRLHNVDIELGKAVVLIGQNNSGKTTALQALALWETGVRRWNERRGGRAAPDKRPGVTINRLDLISIPVPSANLLWKDLHVRDIRQEQGRQVTKNIRVEIIVDGISNGESWVCGLEFDFANQESFHCRPLRIGDAANGERMPVPLQTAEVRVAYLPPMSGLTATEPKWESGRINVLIGEGQTAQVLRNLCFQVQSQDPASWKSIGGNIRELFGIELLDPRYVAERGEITMAFMDRGDIKLDISSAGRGLQQTLLLLAHLHSNPRTVLLLDEPDAHLEILRQRQIYGLLTRTAEQMGSQIVAASHSEVVLNEAAESDIVIAFVGRPHRIDDRGTQVRKALAEIGFDQYYLAEQTGWVLYLEGSTDLAILQAFAEVLNHEAFQHLQKPFVNYVANDANLVLRHYHGLREAKPDLVGVALFDRRGSLPDGFSLIPLIWERREIENYFCSAEVLVRYARNQDTADLFAAAEADEREVAMRAAISEVAAALRVLGKDPWSPETKVSDDFLQPLFERYFDRLGLPNLLRKRGYFELARFVLPNEVDPEMSEKLDAIVGAAKAARPILE